MSYLILQYPNGTMEVLGDVNQARKCEGLPYMDKGKIVSEKELEINDEVGE